MAPAATDLGDQGPDSRDYMATVSRPNLLNLIDLHENEVVRQCELPGVAAPGTLVVSPDGKIAYTLTAAFSDVYGIALDTCEMVFSTQQSQGNVRVKSIASLAILCWRAGSSGHIDHFPMKLLHTSRHFSWKKTFTRMSVLCKDGFHSP